MGSQSDQEWYAKGLRFECTMCGECCTGAPGFVSYTEEEALSIAKHLGITVDEFTQRYTHDTGVKGLSRSLNETETTFGFDCVFLDRESQPGKAVCSLYGARPKQCQTFPWWPGHLASPRAWQRAAKSCEGIGRGPFVPIEDIRIQRDEAASRR